MFNWGGNRKGRTKRQAGLFPSQYRILRNDTYHLLNRALAALQLFSLMIFLPSLR